MSGGGGGGAEGALHSRDPQEMPLRAEGGGGGMHWKGGDLAPRDALEGKGPQKVAPQAVRQAVRGGCQSGWGRLLSVTNAIEAGTWRSGDSGWA